MPSVRWGYVILLVVFVMISWGVRALVSQRVSDRVMEKDEPADQSSAAD